MTKGRKISEIEADMRTTLSTMYLISQEIAKLERYGIENHEYWSRQRIDKESKRLTNTCLKLEFYEEELRELANIWFRRKKYKDIDPSMPVFDVKKAREEVKNAIEKELNEYKEKGVEPSSDLIKKLEKGSTKEGLEKKTLLINYTLKTKE